MATLAKLLVSLGLDSSDFSKGLDGAEKNTKSFGSSIASFAVPAIAGAGVALGGLAVAGSKAFVDLQNSMGEVFTLLPGISQDAMKNMTGQVKQFSKDFGVLPDKVVPALYQSLSAGVPPDNVFAFMTTAQKAAKGGVTDLTVAVDGISSVVNAYGANVVSATKASDLMFTAVKLGKTNFEQLSASLFNVTPTASALGVKFEDVTAALAAMTLQGVPTSVATTQLRSAFVELSKDGTKTSDLFEKLAGKTFKDFIASGGNTQQALQLLEQYAKKSGLGINDLFSSVEAGNAALALTGRGTDAFTNALAGMANAAGATDAAYNTMDNTIQSSINKLLAAGQVALINFGEQLAPTIALVTAKLIEWLPAIQAIATSLVDKLGAGITWLSTNVPIAIQVLIDTFNAWLPTIQTVANFIQANLIPIAAGLAAIIIAVVIPAFVAWVPVAVTAATVTITALLPILIPLALIGAAVALLVKAWESNFLGIRDIITNFWEATGKPIFNQLVDWLQKYIPVAIEAAKLFFTTYLVPAFNAASAFIIGTLIPAFKMIVDFINSPLLPIIKILIEDAIKIVTNVFRLLAELITNIVVPAATMLGSYISTKLQPIFTTISDFIKQNVSPVLQALADKLSGPLASAGETVNSIFEKVSSAISAIGDAISSVLGWIQKMIDKLDSVHVPSILEQHSPSELEQAIIDVGGAAKFATDQIPLLNNALQSMQKVASTVLPDLFAGIPTQGDTDPFNLAGLKAKLPTNSSKNISINANVDARGADRGAGDRIKDAFKQIGDSLGNDVDLRVRLGAI